MRHKLYLFLISTLLFSACNNETTQQRENQPIINQTKASTEQNDSQTQTPLVEKIPVKEYTFKFQDLDKQGSVIKMKNDVYSFSNIQQPIVMVTLFSSWCPPCRGQIPHLSNLQKKFKENLFIIGALVYDDIKNEALKKFIISEKALFFISIKQKENLNFAKMITPKLRLKEDFPMPLMILFFKGKYFTHYEGSMPEEMIESDIEQLLIKIKKGQ
jgi:thiol-disulfide isomerase/thioredoxin